MPIPDRDLFPDFDIFPGFGAPEGEFGPFSDLVLEATSPWSDSNGFWDGYNVALAAMFEPMYDIVHDHGDPNQTLIANLSQQLTAGTFVETLPVLYVAATVPIGEEITLVSGRFFQNLVVSGTPSVGGTSINVEPTFLNADYGIGTPVQLAWIPGWSVLLDPDNCPDQFLPYLAQFNGADVPLGLNADVARSKIINEAGLQRGTLDSVRSAVVRNLIGTQSNSILERVNVGGLADGYFFVVVVRPEECPNSQALIDAVNATKPGGVMWQLVQTDNFIWNQAIHTFAADTFSWNATAYTQP